MENRLELNKRPKYELPDEVIVGKYQYRYDGAKGNTIPNFNPDIALISWGTSRGKIVKPRSKGLEVWIKTDNEKLKDFIKNYKYNRQYNHSLGSYELKKIILEEFYNKQ